MRYVTVVYYTRSLYIAKKRGSRKGDALFLFICLIFRYTEKSVVSSRITYFYYVSKIGANSPYLMYITHHSFDAFFQNNGVRFRLSNPDTVQPFHKALHLIAGVQ